MRKKLIFVEYAKRAGVNWLILSLYTISMLYIRLYYHILSLSGTVWMLIVVCCCRESSKVNEMKHSKKESSEWSRSESPLHRDVVVSCCPLNYLTCRERLWSICWSAAYYVTIFRVNRNEVEFLVLWDIVATYLKWRDTFVCNIFILCLFLCNISECNSEWSINTWYCACCEWSWTAKSWL